MAIDRSSNQAKLCDECGLNPRFASYVLCRDCYNKKIRERRATDPEFREKERAKVERRKATLPQCSADDGACPKQSFAKGLCHEHYSQQRRVDPTRDKCAIPWCSERSTYSIGFCQGHYFQHWNFNIEPINLIALLEDGCEVCHTIEQLQIDHDHRCCDGSFSCGKCVRGALCRSHNHALGDLRDDLADALALIEYIRRTIPQQYPIGQKQGAA